MTDSSTSELACVYSALILHDDDVDITVSRPYMFFIGNTAVCFAFFYFPLKLLVRDKKRKCSIILILYDMVHIDNMKLMPGGKFILAYSHITIYSYIGELLRDMRRFGLTS